MKRTTIMLPNDLADRLRLEAGRRGTSMAEVAREAIESRFGAPGGPRTLEFMAVGDGDLEDGSERVDELVSEAIRRGRQLEQ